MPEIIIDGIKITYTGKANIIDMAKSVGVEIPGFCYHPGLSVSGNCRMCMVEVGMPAREKDGSFAKDENGNTKISFIPKLQPACYQEPSDGMVINTKTEKVMETRKRILEFLLINHPLDCPVCDQAGECILQDYAFQYGFSSSRFTEKKRTFKKTVFSDVITPELNRCIHCDRCSRFTKEIAKDFSFTRTWRGNNTELSALPGEKITHNYQGNMVDICPVGALTLTDFRFKSRTWFLKHSEGICTSCSQGCNVIYSISQNNKVMRIKSRFNANVNSYWMCDYGRLRYSFFNENRRFTHSVSGKEVDFDDARNQASFLIGSATKIAVIASANETLESQVALASFVNTVLKTPHVDFRVHSSQVNHDQKLKEGEILFTNDPYPNSNGAIKAGLVPGNGGKNALDILKNPKEFDLLVVVLDDKIIENQAVLNQIAAFENTILFSAFESSIDHKASVIFPVASIVEQGGTFINGNNIEQSFKAATRPALPIYPLNELLEDLGRRLNSRQLKKGFQITVN
jgi:NADH-quinone oxidoreductase subunit G